MNRQAFERFISSPPFEKDIKRFPTDDAKYSWPGAYCDITVELAWECWKEAEGTAIARMEAQLAEAEYRVNELERRLVDVEEEMEALDRELFVLASDVLYSKNAKNTDWLIDKAKAIYCRPRL